MISFTYIYTVSKLSVFVTQTSMALRFDFPLTDLSKYRLVTVYKQFGWYYNLKLYILSGE